MSLKDGGPAFPLAAPGEAIWTRPEKVWDTNEDLVIANAGMSLRDWFAGQALSGVTDIDMLCGCHDDVESSAQIVNAAVLSYRLADAMIAAREQERS